MQLEVVAAFPGGLTIGVRNGSYARTVISACYPSTSGGLISTTILGRAGIA
jgi:hypothetical protein